MSNPIINISEEMWKITPSGEKSIFHPNHKKKQEEEEREWQERNNKLTGNKNNLPETCKCKIHSRARSLNELIALVKDAEELLIKNKLIDVGDRINCLRGIYYGEEYSMDFLKEKSRLRNLGFSIFTQFEIKNDPRKLLKCCDKCKGNIFQALIESPEIRDAKNKVLDFGHLIIGLDARRSWVAKHTNLPFGGTGLENVTWVGDLGGGAGMLALKRVAKPSTRAKEIVFDKKNDYGASINIEGDIAGYVIGLNIKELDSISNPIDNMEYIYIGLQKYFRKDYWTARVSCFISMIGGVIQNDSLINRDELIENIKDSIEGFAQFYISLRAIDRDYDRSQLIKSFGYIESSAKEVTEIFIDGLLELRKHSNTSSFIANTNPEPTEVSQSENTEKTLIAENIIYKVNKFLKQ